MNEQEIAPIVILLSPQVRTDRYEYRSNQSFDFGRPAVEPYLYGTTDDRFFCDLYRDSATNVYFIPNPIGILLKGHRYGGRIRTYSQLILVRVSTRSTSASTVHRQCYW